MCLALIINSCSKWSEWYITWREFGHQSLFGEKCLSDFSELQSRLVSLSHLYDVIRSDFSIEVEIPEQYLPYPTTLSKWYDEAKKRAKAKRDAEKSKSESNTKGNKNRAQHNSNRTIYNESDLHAYAALMNKSED